MGKGAYDRHLQQSMMAGSQGDDKIRDPIPTIPFGNHMSLE